MSEQLGATCDRGGVTFRVWAPAHARVDVLLEAPGGAAHALVREADGCFSGRVAGAGAGTRYRYRLDGRDDRVFPDPASRCQPDGVHGASMVVDPSAFAWTDDGWTPPPLDRLVIYELHAGAFSPEGTFDGARARLDDLADLGVTAIELMPVADFPGARNWGYDGAALFAPARCYGTPDDLRRLVDAAHARGLAVLLDVVYNHFGPDGAYAHAFSPWYLTDRHQSPWGRGVNVDGPHSDQVRRFFIENALHWIREYHVDGLRLDATHAIVDDSPVPLVAELAARVRAGAGRDALVIAEDGRNLAAMVRPAAAGGWGLDAVWADDLHHELRVHTAHDRDGYYVDFSGSTADIATTLRQGWFYTGQVSAHGGAPRGTDPSGLAPRQFVVCIQNHDQIGNRAEGDRITAVVDPAVYRALSALILLAPQTPLLFMGQEWAASTPFLYFTDHEPDLGRQVTAGRREEFARFAAFADPARRARIPDPQAPGTFERSRLDWRERDAAPHAGVRRLYQRLLALRAARPAPSPAPEVQALDAGTVSLDWGAGGMVVVVRLSGAGAVTVPADRGGVTVALSTEDGAFATDPAPIAVEGTRVRFARPGAVVLARPAL